METNSFDPTKAEAFAGQMMNVINGGFLSLAVTIGRKTGLFDSLNGMKSSTSEEIAGKTGLNERYVREWLGALVVGKIIDYNPVNKTYSLAPEHAAFLTESAGMDNMSVMAQTLFTTVNSIDNVIECFYKGGGVKYDEYSQCLHCIKELSLSYYDSLLIEKLLPLVPRLKEKLEKGIDVLDIGCGHGHAINSMAKTFPNSRFTGYDFVEESINSAREEAKKWKLKNSKFKVKDVAIMNEQKKFDLITAFDAIHDQSYPRIVLKNIYNALRKDGIFFMADIKASSNLEENIEHPLGPTFYTVSLTHCMTVSLAYGGEGLGTMWGKQLALQLLKDAGFDDTKITEVPEDIMNYYYISVKK